MSSHNGNGRELESPEARSVLWKAIIEMLRVAHEHRLPGRRFGPDLQLLLIYGAAVVAYSNKRPVRASNIARYLDIPNETARRCLQQLVKLDLLEPYGHTHRPTEKTARAFSFDRAKRLIAEAARVVL